MSGKTDGEIADEPAADFYARLTRTQGTDIDLEAVNREERRIDRGPVIGTDDAARPE